MARVLFQVSPPVSSASTSAAADCFSTAAADALDRAPAGLPRFFAGVAGVLAGVAGFAFSTTSENKPAYILQIKTWANHFRVQVCFLV